MPKSELTPREQLVRGKLDRLFELVSSQVASPQIIEAADLISMIRHDCERMEAKLVARKDEVARLTSDVERLTATVTAALNERDEVRLRITAACSLVEQSWNSWGKKRHKQWILDRVMRAILADGYTQWVSEDMLDDDGESYWEEGIKP